MESPALLRRARKVDAAGLAWERLGDRFDLRWICRRSTILGLEHRTRAEAQGAQVIHGVVPPGREALASALLQLFAPPTDRGAETSARVVAGDRALDLANGAADLASSAHSRVVLPTLVWVEPSGHPQVHIAPPVADAESNSAEISRLATLLAPLSEILDEHPSAWPWHRLGPPPSVAPNL